jgi:hypothetical protein
MSAKILQFKRKAPKALEEKTTGVPENEKKEDRYIRERKAAYFKAHRASYF